MTRIYFIGPYAPIMCGIADYTRFITKPLPTEKWAALSFDLTTYSGPLTDEDVAPRDCVWYGIPDDNRFSPSAIEEGLGRLGCNRDEAVLWFQHEFGIWPDDQKFISMIRQLNLAKVVTMHTVHFQSRETPYGLRRSEYRFLRDLLPHVDALTVFSRGARCAVEAALPEHRSKVHVIRHGIHSYPDVARMTHREAKERLGYFLLYESALPQKTREELYRQAVFTDPANIVVGQTGFLCPLKGSEHLYEVKDKLQRALPWKKIAAVRIGTPRGSSQEAYVEQLREKTNNTDKLLIPTLLPPEILPVAQRAFDINLYWPRDCTQSGIVAHALGARAIMAGRDMEGTGEIFKDAGSLTAPSLRQLIMRMEQIILFPEFVNIIEQKALEYSTDFSWKNQAQEHHALAQSLVSTGVEPFEKAVPIEIASETVSDIALAHLPAVDLLDQDVSLLHEYADAERPFVVNQGITMQDAPAA